MSPETQLAFMSLKAYLTASIEKARGEAAMWSLRKDTAKTRAAVAVADALGEVLKLVEG